jgi:hypothetical protein
MPSTLLSLQPCQVLCAACSTQCPLFLQVLMPGPSTKAAAIMATYGGMNPLDGMWLQSQTTIRTTQRVVGKVAAVKQLQQTLPVTPRYSTVYSCLVALQDAKLHRFASWSLQQNISTSMCLLLCTAVLADLQKTMCLKHSHLLNMWCSAVWRAKRFAYQGFSAVTGPAMK